MEELAPWWLMGTNVLALQDSWERIVNSEVNVSQIRAEMEVLVMT